MRNHYAVSSDGQRFLVNTVAADLVQSIIGILNWTEALGRR